MVDSPVPLRSGDPMEEDRSPGAIAKMYHQSSSHLVIGALRYDGGRNTGRIESTRVSLLIHNSTQGWKNLRLYIHVRTCSMVFGLSYRVQDPWILAHYCSAVAVYVQVGAPHITWDRCYKGLDRIFGVGLRHFRYLRHSAECETLLLSPGHCAYPNLWIRRRDCCGWKATRTYMAMLTGVLLSGKRDGNVRYDPDLVHSNGTATFDPAPDGAYRTWLSISVQRPYVDSGQWPMETWTSRSLMARVGKKIAFEERSLQHRRGQIAKTLPYCFHEFDGFRTVLSSQNNISGSQCHHRTDVSLQIWENCSKACWTDWDWLVNSHLCRCVCGAFNLRRCKDGQLSNIIAVLATNAQEWIRTLFCMVLMTRSEDVDRDTSIVG